MSLPLLAAAFGLAFYGGGKELRRYERLMTDSVAAQLSTDPKNVQVKFSLGSFQVGHLSQVSICASNFSIPSLPLSVEKKRSQAGAIDSLHVEFKHFVLNGLPIDRLQADLIGNRWDVVETRRSRKLVFSKSGKGTFEARLDEQGLMVYIKHRYPQITPTSLQIDPYKIIIEGKIASPFGSSRFYTIARSRLTGPVTLDLDPAYLSFNEKTASDALKASFLKTINPVIELNRDFQLNNALAMKTVRLEKGYLVIIGEAIIPEAK